MAHDDSHLGELESTLKQHATQLVDSLEKGRFGEAVGLIHELNKARDHGLYQEIGAVLGVSESRVCQIHGQAVLRLRGRLGQYESRDAGLDDE